MTPDKGMRWHDKGRTTLKESMPKLALLIEKEPCETALGLLKTFPKHPILCIMACSLVIYWVNVDDDFKKRFRHGGGCQAVLDVLINHQQNKECCEVACNVIAELWKPEDEGGCQAVVDVLKNHSENMNLCAMACRALYALSHQKNRRLLHSMCGVISAALKKFPFHVSLCSYACRAIEKLGTLGYLPDVCNDVVATLFTNVRNAHVCLMTCIAIHGLAANKKNREHIGWIGGCSAIVHALRTFPRISLEACGALEILTKDNEINRAAIAKADGAMAIINALDRQTFECSAKILFRISAAKPAIRATDKCSDVLKAIHHHQESAVILIYILAHNEENRQRFGREGGCKAIVDILLHTRNPSSAAMTMWAIQQLAKDEDCRRYIGDKGGCEAVVSIMKRYVSNHRTSRAACMAILFLAKNKENQKRLEKETKNLHDVMEKCKHDSLTCIAAQQAMTSVTSS